MTQGVLRLILCILPVVAAISGEVIAATASTSPEVLIVQADAAYAQRSDLSQAQAALQGYEQASSADPAGAEAYWKASRVAWWLGDHAARSADKIRYFQKGIDAARVAIARNPKGVEGHFWLAANEGSYGEAKGVLKSLFLVKPIRREMAVVLRLNDHFLGGGGYRVLGVVDYKVPGFAGGSKKRALEELNKALAIDPQDPFTHYYLAEYYRITGDKEKSRAELEVLRSLQVPPDSQPELQMLQQKAENVFGP